MTVEVLVAVTVTGWFVPIGNFKPLTKKFTTWKHQQFPIPTLCNIIKNSLKNEIQWILAKLHKTLRLFSQFFYRRCAEVTQVDLRKSHHTSLHILTLYKNYEFSLTVILPSERLIVCHWTRYGWCFCLRGGCTVVFVTIIFRDPINKEIILKCTVHTH